MGETVAVWPDARGIPSRFVWEGRRYRITDTPTRFDPDQAAVTHPPSTPAGWRFQGTSEDGEDTRVFDVLYIEARQEWLLLHSYR